MGVGYGEHGSGHSDPAKGDQVLDQLSDCQVFKKESAVLSSHRLLNWYFVVV